MFFSSNETLRLKRTACDHSPPLRPDAAADSSLVVILADETRRDISGLSAVELKNLLWEQDRDFAARILAGPRGSVQRTRAVRQAYETIPVIFSRWQTREGNRVVLGMDDRYAILVSKLLRRQRRRNLSPSFLEIGFGSGKMLKSVADEGYPITGIEASQHLRNQAVELLGSRFETRLIVADFLQYRPDSARAAHTLIYWNDVFEHIPPDEIQDYVEKIHSLLAPGGSLVTITPNWHLRPSDATVIHHPPRTEAQGLHLKEYTLREITAMLRRAGFARVDVPLFLTRKNIFIAGSGLAREKRFFEPLLEWMPFRLAQILCRGLGMYCTIATKPHPTLK